MLIRILTTILVYSFFGWLLCDIDPEKNYEWLAGIWHGLFFPANYIRHFFWDCEFKAVSYTAAYNVFYWIFAISSTLGFFFGGTRMHNSDY